MARLIKLLSLPPCLLLLLIVVVTSSGQTRRDLAYLKQLEALLDSVEKSLEEYGATEPDCQKRATCEIYKKSADGFKLNNHEKDFIKLVNEMRKEIKNPKVVPLARMVFESYEEAAINGETRLDCKQFYKECP